jgi:two-component system phosphate regulon sensor histidine kinase PhoR
VTLSRKLFFSYLVVVSASTLTLVVAADRSLRTRLEREATVEMEREAHLLAAATTGARGPDLQRLVEELGRRTGRRLTVIDSGGAVIADSDFPFDQLVTLENHARRPEFRAALAGSVGTDLRRSASTGRTELKVAVPAPGGSARVSSPLPQVDAVVRGTQGTVLVGGLVALLVGAALALGFARFVARPLVSLRDAAQAIARGGRPTVDVRGRDEVGDLARSFRALEESLDTRLAELERERSETAAIIAAMSEGVIACDARGLVTTSNPAAQRMLSLADTAPVPPAAELFRQPSAQEAVRATLGGGGATAVEVEVDQQTVLLSGRALPNGGGVFVLHDVTELKRLEAVRRDFVANVSHELKTPLTLLRGWAETLLSDDPPAETRRGILATVLANSRRMQRLVDDLLDLSKIESRAWRPEPEPVAIEPLARGVWAEIEGEAQPGRHVFATEIAPNAASVWADPQAMRQIMANLLENAARYTPPGGRIDVRSTSASGAVVVEVRDTGMGIPGPHLPRIFERFYRVDAARSRELGGTGLGLAIVKHLVEAHGGRVEAESVLGVGTTIRVRLPQGPIA